MEPATPSRSAALPNPLLAPPLAADNDAAAADDEPPPNEGE